MNVHNLNFTGRQTAPVILQSEAAECGLACLAMISSFHGARTDMVHLRRRFSVSMKGVTLAGLMAMAESLEMSGRPVRFALKGIGQLRLPCILHWDMNHFVVLTEVQGRWITIHDPARGKRKLHLREAGKHITGVALELVPTKNFEKKEEKASVRLWDFWERARGLKRSLMQLFLLSALLQIFALAAPFYTQLVVDEAITKGDLDFLTVLAIGFGLILVIRTATTVLRSYVSLYFGNMLSYQTRTNLFHHLLRLPTDYFEKRHIGDVTSRFGSMQPVQTLFTSGIIAVILDGLMAISTLILMLIYSWQLTLIVVGILVLFLGGRLAVFPIMRRWTEENIHLSALESTNFLEAIRAARTVKMFGREQEREAQ